MEGFVDSDFAGDLDKRSPPPNMCSHMVETQLVGSLHLSVQWLFLQQKLSI